MGREKTILLGFLGLLAGVFVGVLSLKLLVPRPPTGTGPDIRPEVAVATAQQRVDPPAPSAHGWDFAAAPPLVADAPAAVAADATTEPPRSSRFAAPAAAAPVAAPPVALARTDEVVAPVSWQQSEPAVGTVADPVRPAQLLPVAGAYVVQAGDSWWDLADRAYGDGRLYRALFAWNRSRDPRVTLAPGTRLDVPPLDRLQATWPRLASPTLPH
jgi:5'-nucleotidase/UDP-sugar diphosphatase